MSTQKESCPWHSQFMENCPHCITANESRIPATEPTGCDDSAMLDWLEKQQGSALVSDDHSRWAIAGTGFQSLPSDEPTDIETHFLILADEWKPTVREAIRAAMQAEQP